MICMACCSRRDLGSGGSWSGGALGLDFLSWLGLNLWFGDTFALEGFEGAGQLGIVKIRLGIRSPKSTDGAGALLEKLG